MVTALYAAILAALMIWLSIQVIKQRRKAQVKYADGGVDALTIARSAQGNAVDYIPITLILMAMVEYNGASPWMIHACGIVFVLGRILHAKGILADRLKGRISGMKMTFLVMVVLIALNIAYLPFDRMW
ncbi:MAPEG family protein [Vibrio europaeus]|uniref:MAPEG family protein n=1 Tax=Vibrio europaeus TaxID=300876 RepID=A0A178J761_9VIBR|nr:MAPEG family protein [Vibrio europaeus]MDC5705793.1 MAPEG family protein [Vibrio europaeus]MDC5709203.1 MAPEG family protein [Vibrio europaeus]MDC5713602.1 MAPEG family protein [Vibrio europaeus]MDC5720322.1 MAPEG family protein [Vibrio europaeus]MDC5723791.1 MAPEG family protein [Vibrio europaeus]